jgi:DNA modification methylase
MKPYAENHSWKLYQGDCRAVMAEMEPESVHCCVTSPPFYGLRDYQVPETVWPGIQYAPMPGLPPVTIPEWTGCLGLEETPEAFVGHIVEVFRGVWRVMRGDSVFWLNMGDSYAASRSYQVVDNKHRDVGNKIGHSVPPALKQKDLMGIPWRCAFALQADGWFLRSAPSWIKRAAMPESCTDRPGSAHETVFMLTKNKRYFFDMEAVKKKSTSDHPAGNKTHKYQDSVGFVPGGGHKSKTTGLTDIAGIEWRTRNYRTSDFYFESLDEYIAHLQAVRDGGGMLLDIDGNPVGLDINPKGFSGAHFACFPPKLVEPLILSATSEKGACVECGAPWERVVEKTGEKVRQHWAPGTQEKIDTAQGRHGESSVFNTGHIEVKTTLNWQPTYTCTQKETTPCTVFDPFAGAGTTALTAYKLDRKCVMIELGQHNCDLIADRLRSTNQLRLFA